MSRWTQRNLIRAVWEIPGWACAMIYNMPQTHDRVSCRVVLKNPDGWWVESGRICVEVKIRHVCYLTCVHFQWNFMTLNYMSIINFVIIRENKEVSWDVKELYLHKTSLAQLCSFWWHRLTPTYITVHSDWSALDPTRQMITYFSI
jgi:hypothetical protein